MIIYAALSGTNGGIWRSENTGQTWTQMLAGNATSVVLDPNSGTVLNPSTGTHVQGNLQVVYAGFAAPTGTSGAAAGVYLSPNQGQVWNLMTGGVGNPLIIDDTTGADVNPATNPSPNGVGGRIILAVPAPNGNAVEDAIYSGWLYAAVSTPAAASTGCSSPRTSAKTGPTSASIRPCPRTTSCPGLTEPDPASIRASRPTTLPLRLTPSPT